MPKSGNGNMLGRYTHSWAMRSLLAATAVVLCLAPLRAQDVAAKAITVSGQVALLKDGNPWVLNEGDTVKPKQIIVTGRDGYAQFRVADGSTFEVFQNAKVTFRENYPSWTDLVQVWLGRIRVQIEHRLGANPNSVSTPTAVISVRGTIFDVVVEDEDDTTLVSVEEGLVDVQHKLKYGPVVRLNPGESIRVCRNQPLARMVDKDPAVRAGLNLSLIHI